MRKFGLIGYPLNHSFSPAYFRNKFIAEGINDASYDLYPLSEINLVRKVMTTGLLGFNVTIPYKKQILPFLDDLDDISNAIGAVNCVANVEGKWLGYNTDASAFEKSLLKQVDMASTPQALVFGTGGASLAVIYTFKKLSISYLTVSSSGLGDLRYSEVTPEIISKHLLLVNATPSGSFNFLTEYPLIPYEAVTTKHFLFDLIYNPEKTLFLTYGQSRGAKISNGYEMLTLQAEQSWNIWNKN